MGDPLTLVEDVKAENFIIKNITTESVASIRQIFDKLKKGELNRHYAETFMNHSSSRSHCIFRLTIRAMTNNFIKEFRKNNAGSANINVHSDISHQEGTIVTESYLNFVDLAGSERMSAHIKNNGAMDDEEDVEKEEQKVSKVKISNRIKEGKHINKSLFYLARVISLKAEGKANQYIPYRNSPLTKILRSSLGGNFRTAVVCCINPTDSQAEHSISTLRFGSNAKKIQNKVQANILTHNDDETVKLLIDNYERRMREIRQQQDDELIKQQQYVAIIDELRMQRTALLDRIEAANKKLAAKLLDEIEEEEAQVFFGAFIDEVPYRRSTGALFTSRQLVKTYQEMAQAEGLSPGSFKRSKADRILEKFEKEFKVEEVKGVSVLDAAALAKIDTLRKEMDTLKTGFEDQRAAILSFFQSYKTLCGFLQTVTQLGQVYLGKLRDIIQEYEDEYLLSNERSIKLELYEQFKGLALLTDKDLVTMKEYVADFADALQSETNRRELLASQETRLPQSVVEGLDGIKVIEQEEQSSQMQHLKSKIEDFAKFKEGCTSEIDYYKSICAEFEQQSSIQAGSKDIERLINEDLQPLAEKVKAMEANLRDFNKTLEVKRSDQITRQLQNYKSKFEKLVDVVLNEKKKRDKSPEEIRSPERNMAGELMTTTNERYSIGSRGGKLKRSSSICLVEDRAESVTKTVTQLPEKLKIESKVRGWLTLKALEDRPLDYESVLRDETSSITNQIKSPLVKKEQDLNTSFSDLRSQMGNNYLCSDFASPLLFSKLKDTNNRNLKTAFDQTKVEPKMSDRERSSYRSNLDSRGNRSAQKNNKKSILILGKGRKLTEDDDFLFRSGGLAPVVKLRQGNLRPDTRRRQESKSYKASDMEMANTFKRSFSNIGKIDGNSLFGSATDFQLNSRDYQPSDLILTDNRFNDEERHSIKESFIIHQADDFALTMPGRNQSEAIIEPLKENTKTIESSVKKPKLLSQSPGKSKDRPSPWRNNASMMGQKPQNTSKIVSKEAKPRAPSEKKPQEKTESSTVIYHLAKTTSKLNSSASRGLFMGDNSRILDFQTPDLFTNTTSKIGERSPNKEKRPSSSQLSKDHSHPRSIKGKIESLVSNLGYRGYMGKAGPPSMSRKY